MWNMGVDRRGQHRPLTQQTTLPLALGSSAPSSATSSFTTLNKEQPGLTLLHKLWTIQHKHELHQRIHLYIPMNAKHVTQQWKQLGSLLDPTASNSQLGYIVKTIWPISLSTLPQKCCAQLDVIHRHTQLLTKTQ